MDASPPPAADAGPSRRRPRWRVWLLGLIGTLAVVLPLAQVLRFQVDALVEAQSERAWLDPLVEAVAVHRGLAAHDEATARMLRGRTAQDAERRLHQALVDRHLATLQGLLWAGEWRQAHREATGLHGEWRRLVGEIEGRRIDAAASQQAHRMLQEQAVQVMDLVQAAAPAALALRELFNAPERIEARRAPLDRRVERARATVALVAVSLGAVLALAAAAVLGLLRETRRRSATAADSDGSDDVRRSHGRRAGDRAAVTAPAALARAELDQLRRAAEDERSGG